MKKRLKEIFSISRNERIGLLCIIVIIGLILIIKCVPNGNVPEQNINQASSLLKDQVDSTTVTNTKKKRAKKKQQPKEVKHLKVSSMEEIKQE